MKDNGFRTYNRTRDLPNTKQEWLPLNRKIYREEKRKPALTGMCMRLQHGDGIVCVADWSSERMFIQEATRRKKKKGCVTVGLHPEIGLPRPKFFQTSAVPSHATLRVTKHRTTKTFLVQLHGMAICLTYYTSSRNLLIKQVFKSQRHEIFYNLFPCNSVNCLATKKCRSWGLQGPPCNQRVSPRA
jgi:hypothetical protein